MALVTVGTDRGLLLLDGSTGELTDLAASAPAAVVATSAGGGLLAAADPTGRIDVWDLTTPDRPRQTFGGGEGPVLAVAWSPDGAQLAVTGHDATVRLWDVVVPDPLQTQEPSRRWTLGRTPVHVESTDERLRRRVDESPLLRLAAAREVPSMTIAGMTALVVRDAEERDVNATAYPVSDSGIGQALEVAERIARAARLRTLQPALGDVDVVMTVELGRRVDGRSVSAADGLFHVGDSLTLTITSGDPRTLYVATFDVGTGYDVTMITNAAPDGVRLDPGGRVEVFGADGAELYWSDSVPREPRPESLLVIAATAPQRFELLTRRWSRATAGDLESLLLEVGYGERNLRTAEPGQLAYRMAWLDFTLDPTPRGVEPQSTERSSGSSRPGASLTMPAAIRLNDLHLAADRTKGPLAMRIDALVVTRPGEDLTALPVTMRDERWDGRLPLEDTLIYEGEVSGTLDVAVWVHRADGGPDLAELLDKASEVRRIDGSLIVTAPDGVVDERAVASLFSTVAGLLGEVTRQRLAEFRMSHRADERYGAGRHDVESIHTDETASLAYEIVDLDTPR